MACFALTPRRRIEPFASGYRNRHLLPRRQQAPPSLPLEPVCPGISSRNTRNKLNFPPILCLFGFPGSYRKRTPGSSASFNSTIRTDGAPEEETVARAIASGLTGFRLDRFFQPISENSDWIGLIRLRHRPRTRQGAVQCLAGNAILAASPHNGYWSAALEGLWISVPWPMMYTFPPGPWIWCRLERLRANENSLEICCDGRGRASTVGLVGRKRPKTKLLALCLAP